jgi:hypothetical protein
MCGMQQNLELFSIKEVIHVEFNTSEPPMAEHRGFQIDYEFSEHFVDVGRFTGDNNVRAHTRTDRMIAGESGVTHVRGTECDIRVLSNKETMHWIRSPNVSTHTHVRIWS